MDGLGLSNSTTSAATSTSLLLPASPTSDVSNRDNQQNSSSSSPRLNFSNPAVIGGTAAIAAVILLIVIWLVIFVRRHMLNKSLRDRSAGEGSGNRRAGRNRAERMSFAGSFNEMIKKDRNYFVSQAVNDNQLSASRSEKAKKKSTLSTPTIDHLCRDHSSSTNNNSIITKYSFDQGRQDILNSSAPSTTFIYTHPEQIPIVKPFEYHMNNMRSTTISSQNSSVVNQDNLLQKISSLTTANSKQSGYIQPLPQDLETEAEDLTSTASSPVQQPAPPMQTRQLRRFIPPTEYDD